PAASTSSDSGPPARRQATRTSKRAGSSVRARVATWRSVPPTSRQVRNWTTLRRGMRAPLRHSCGGHGETGHAEEIEVVGDGVEDGGDPEGDEREQDRAAAFLHEVLLG